MVKFRWKFINFLLPKNDVGSNPGWGNYFFQFFHSLPPSFWIWQTKYFLISIYMTRLKSGWIWLEQYNQWKVQWFYHFMYYLIQTFSNNSKTPHWTLKIFYLCDSTIKWQTKMALKNCQNKVIISASVLTCVCLPMIHLILLSCSVHCREVRFASFLSGGSNKFTGNWQNTPLCIGLNLWTLIHVWPIIS